MSITFHINKSKQLTTFTVEGEISFTEIMRTIKSFFEGEPTENVLWDFRDAKAEASLSTQEIEKIACFTKQHRKLRESGKTSIVASSDFEFGLSRMYQIFSEIEMVPHTVRTFRSFDDAVKWLDSEE